MERFLSLIGKMWPYLVAAVFGLSGAAHLYNPSTAILSLASMLPRVSFNSLAVIIGVVTSLELAITVLLFGGRNRSTINMATGLLLAFTGFLFLQTFNPNAAPCGCSPLSIVAEEGKAEALLGMVRNTILIGGLSISGRKLPGEESSDFINGEPSASK